MSVVKYPSLPILIVDDELDAIHGCESLLRSGGINHTLGCQDSREVLSIMEKQEVSLVLLDLFMPHILGKDILVTINENMPHVPVIIFTGMNDLETAVECMRLGAFDYMVKPVEESRIVSSVKRAIEMRELAQEYASFKDRVLSNALEYPEAFAEIVTNNSTMRSIFQYAETIARTARPVLVTGETGVGKELVARAVHNASGRTGSFVAVNAAGVDDNVFSDTLFGHQKGAFTDASESRPGLITQATGGTLFLDEIGDLNHASQLKLLRLLQEGEYYPIGVDVPKQTDARIVMATNQDVKALTQEGKLRKDLYYRIQTHHINIPPLRERLDDIPLLVDHFLEKAAAELDKKKPTPPKELYSLLATYSFPGNVRELESVIFNAVSHHESRMLSMNLFKAHIQEHRSSQDQPSEIMEKGRSPFSLFEELPTLKEAQSLLIEEAMHRTKGNQTLAARLLGISQPGLSKALKREKG